MSTCSKTRVFGPLFLGGPNKPTVNRSLKRFSSLAEDQWNETAHELDKRFMAIIRHSHLSPSQADDVLRTITELVETYAIDIIPRNLY